MGKHDLSLANTFLVTTLLCTLSDRAPYLHTPADSPCWCYVRYVYARASGHTRYSSSIGVVRGVSSYHIQMQCNDATLLLRGVSCRVLQ